MRAASIPFWAICTLLLVASPSVTFAAEQKLAVEGEAEGKGKIELPTPNQLRILIRSTIVALDHANGTGNYTVLRDLGAPGFQRANSSARLAELFAPLRQQKINLGPVLLIEPKLVKPPSLNEQGHLRVTGFFPSNPLQVQFDLAYERVEDNWSLFGVAVSVAPSKVANGKTQEAKPQKAVAKQQKQKQIKAGAAGSDRPAKVEAAAQVQPKPVDAAPFQAAPPAQEKSDDGADWNPFR